MPKRPIELDCIEVWRHISDYIDDVVDVDFRAAMAHHFKDCAHCSAILDGSRNVVKLVGDGKVFDIPSPASKNLYARLDQYLSSKQSHRKSR
jgi:hypothetical protein